jgi:cell fate regulator YaaT (PSP1 superfamily)
MKISGPCGRLLCCLSYEHAFYSERVHCIPQENTRISYNSATWVVSEVNVVTGQIKMTDSEGRLTTLPAERFEYIDNRWRVK